MTEKRYATKKTSGVRLRPAVKVTLAKDVVRKLHTIARLRGITLSRAVDLVVREYKVYLKQPEAP